MTADGRLAENVMHFARVLRAAGLPIGPDRVLDAVRALEVAGVERREDFYWTLASVFLGRREHLGFARDHLQAVLVGAQAVEDDVLVVVELLLAGDLDGDLVADLDRT